MNEPAWKRVNALFERHRLPPPPTRLRDELVGWLLSSEALLSGTAHATEAFPSPSSTDPVPVEDGRPNLDDLVAAHVQQMTEVVIPQIEDDLKQQARSATRLRLDLPSTDPVPVGVDEHPTPDAAGELAEALAAADEAVTVMARAFERIHSMPRTSDTELAERVSKAKERLRQAASRLRSQGSE